MPHTDTVIDGILYPSVTEIVGMIDKPFLRRWYGKHGLRLCEKKLEVSGKIGTQYHDLVARMVNGIKVEAPTKRLRGMCASFGNWLNENEFIPEVQEFKVISHKYRYAGTLDAIGRLKNGGLVILDWKSSAGIYPEQAYQLGGYAGAYEEKTGIKISEGWVIQVDKKPPYALHTRKWTNLDVKFAMFLRLREVYADLHPKKG